MNPTNNSMLVRDNFLWRTALLWGLGTGTTLLLCIAAYAAFKIGFHDRGVLATLLITGGITGAGCLALIILVNNRLAIEIAGSGQTARNIGFCISVVVMFTMGAVMSLFMPVIILASILRKDHAPKPKRKSFNQIRHSFEECVPRHLSFG